MLILGHVGISLGAAQLFERVVLRRRRGLDYRLLMVGALLPDMIDKPVGLYILGDVIHSGRIVGHTLLFSLVLLGVGVWRYRRGNAVLLSLGLGTLLHLVLDEMWLQPAVLWWPVLGWSMVESWSTPFGSFVHSMINAYTMPRTYATELLGGLIVAHFLWRVLRGRQRWRSVTGPAEEVRRR
ncbi:MAG: metal-dependent hydrolase [Dehalococcoidia bacterium]|nr:metal-dependent hydrolase [Dehalococcoidia bacterium]MDP7469709.1 metal-dependent hydrolase [Dehalococcoidia bacterium]